MTRAVLIPVDGPPELVDIPGEAADAAVYAHLARMFPDAFDGIRLGPDVIGYVSDVGLLDGSPSNPRAVGLVDDVYQQYAGRAYHSCIHGPMVVLGVTRSGASVGVPDAFLAEHFPALAAGVTS